MIKTIGAQYFDDSPKTTTAQKITARAADFYRKYGVVPTVCEVHTSSDAPDAVGNINVRRVINVGPNVYFIRAESQADAAQIGMTI